MVSKLFGASQFAIYNFSAKINNLFNEAGEHYQNAYDPILYKGLSNNNLDVKNFRQILFTWSYFILLGLSIFIIFGQEIINIVTNGVFIDSYPLVLLYTCVIVITLPFMGNAQVLIFNKETKYLLLITVIQTLIIIICSVILIPRFGVSAGIFSLWLGTFVYFLLYFYKKRKLFKDYFIEKESLSYVLLYHLSILLFFFNKTSIGYIVLGLLNILMFTHFVIINKRIIKDISLKFLFK